VVGVLVNGFIIAVEIEIKHGRVLQAELLAVLITDILFVIYQLELVFLRVV
jgi:hypothetical protein